MPHFHMRLPKLGESVTEATIIAWVKSVGDQIQLDETIVEIATDKVDSELPSPVEGTLAKIHAQIDDVIQVGGVIATIEVSEATFASLESQPELEEPPSQSMQQEQHSAKEQVAASSSRTTDSLLTPYIGGSLEKTLRPSQTNRFYSPLVRSIASIEGLSVEELDRIEGTGSEGRVTREDVELYLNHRSSSIAKDQISYTPSPNRNSTPEVRYDHGTNIERIPMDRRRKMIAEHMVRSKQTSPHVTSFLELDVTDLVDWRNNVKEEWQMKKGDRLTYTPLFIRAVTKAIQDYPAINASVDGSDIILKKSINIGMATLTTDDQLLVPVIKDAEQHSLEDLSTFVNDLALRARNHQLKPDEVQGGTFTVTNVGSFGNTMGAPIINQPQVAILSLGKIRRTPGIVMRDGVESIEPRSMMFISLSYDHRIVDGALGGRFMRRVGDYLEQVDLLMN